MIRREKTKKKVFVSDKIADLYTVKPSADVEDDQIFGTKPKTVTRDELESDGDSAEEAELSNFRKQNSKLLAELSDRYAGEVATRRDLELKASDDESDKDSIEVDSDDLASDSEDEKNVPKSKTSDNEGSLDRTNDSQGENSGEESLGEEEASEYDEGSGEDDSDMEGSQDGFNLSEMDKVNEKKEEFKHFKEKDSSEDVDKGRCVKNQLALWENLLEMRINMQKCLVTVNKMPLPETIKKLKKEGEEFTTALNKSKGSAASLLSRLLELQRILLLKYPETENILNKDKHQEDHVMEDPLDEEILSDEASVTSDKPVIKVEPPTLSRKRKITDYAGEIATRHSTYSKYRNSVIQKWNDKTKVAKLQKDQNSKTSTVAQIEFILNDKNKLIRRTQLRRSKYEIIGEEKNIPEKDDDVEIEDKPPVDFDRRNLDEEYCLEIFDDDDFYHQLLRELIEYKSADISDPIQLSHQWIMLQQMRSKMKRKVDTRATKGRRIRYAVHSKLVNFMAPEVNLEWTDEMKDELYASLFGKQFEGNNDHIKSKKITNGNTESVET